MANKRTDFESGTDTRENTPGMDTDDRTEQVRGTADDEADDFESEDEELDEEDEEEGTF